MIVVESVDEHSDLQQLVDEINAATWGVESEMTRYDAESLAFYFSHMGTLFVVCHEVDDDNRLLLGIASARLEVKPYDKERWLYVDEVDVCANHRRKGAGTAIMKKLFSIAEEARCTELWLGTETDNKAANALYGSLEPKEAERFVGYACGLS